MHFFSLVVPATLASVAASAKVYLAGDSTMALGGGGGVTQGTLCLVIKNDCCAED